MTDSVISRGLLALLMARKSLFKQPRQRPASGPPTSSWHSIHAEDGWVAGCGDMGASAEPLNMLSAVLGPSMLSTLQLITKHYANYHVAVKEP